MFILTGTSFELLCVFFFSFILSDLCLPCSKHYSYADI